jgi:hypothetical protein
MTVNTSTPREVPRHVGEKLDTSSLTSNSKILFHRLRRIAGTANTQYPK